MLRFLIDNRGLVACCLGAISGSYLLTRYPFPVDNPLLVLIQFHKPAIFHAFRWSYTILCFTTPFILSSMVLSLIYVFLGRRSGSAGRGKLPPYPAPAGRSSLMLVVGEIHHPKKPVPAEHPTWLTIPERGLYTGIAVVGAIGSGKTSCCMYPFAEQILAYGRGDPSRRIGGLILEVKGDFCHKVRDILRRHGRESDYIEMSLNSPYRYNPLHNDIEAYALAYGIASLLNNLFGRGKEPFWQQAYTNLVKFIILLHKVLYNYVTFFDVYECAINPDLLEERIEACRKLFTPAEYILVEFDAYMEHGNYLDPKGFVVDSSVNRMRAPFSNDIQRYLESRRIPFETETVEGFGDSSAAGALSARREQFEAVARWFHNDWKRIEPKLRTSIVEGISVFLSLFDDNPAVKRTFCPPRECYDPEANHDGRYGIPLPSFSDLIERGAVCALNLPLSLNPGLARTIGTLMKLDFERAVLNRIPKIEQSPGEHFRQVLFLCDEYQAFATVGESDPTGDEKFFSLSRQAKCIPIVATQSISSLRSTLPGESWRTLLQTFRTKVFLSLSDDFSARVASDLCGKEEQLKEQYSISEHGIDAGVNVLTGRTTSRKTSINTSKSYNVVRDSVFEPKIFAELRNAQSIVLAYDGLNPMPPAYCYLKPYYLNPNRTWFEQSAAGEI
ncbi:MAG: hypothetical protein FJW35_07770 [Acidobacteria bacterium]|nr:hypothetical protein [Acidobacteriota bacterium]